MIRQEQKELAYRVYMADTLWGIAHGRSMDMRYLDIINPKPKETRTAEEVIDHIKQKLEGGERS